MLTDFGLPASAVRAVAIQADGKIVVAGGSWDPHTGVSRFGLARYTVRCHLDPTFGRGGKVVTSFGAYSDASAAALAIQRDGKLVVAGSDLTDTRGERGYFAVALARYNTGGALDPSFGAGGRVVSKVDTTAVARAPPSSRQMAGSSSLEVPVPSAQCSFATPPTASSTRASGSAA